jgi:hypothetical protein
VVDVLAQGALEPAAADAEQPVEAPLAQGPDEALGVGSGVRRLERRADNLDPLGPEDLVEPGAELGIAVVDQKAQRPLATADFDHEVARLLGGPCRTRVRAAAREVHAPGVELNREQRVQAPQPHCVDRDEVARDHSLLGTQELAPARTRPPRRRRELTAPQHRAHRGRRHLESQLARLADDPPVAPARVLAREPDDQGLEPRVARDQWKSWGSGRSPRVSGRSVTGFTSWSAQNAAAPVKRALVRVSSEGSSLNEKAAQRLSQRSS